MKTTERILKYLQDRQDVGYHELLLYFDDIAESTLVRNLNILVDQGSLIKKKSGRNTSYRIAGKHAILQYFTTPFFQRPKVRYNHDFLRDYVPNTSSFFHPNQLDTLHQAIQDINIDTDFFHTNKRLLEMMLIDLSFASSSLEGNTYDYVDTEILIKYNEIAKDKSQDETQMIINHKRCIEYMIYQKNSLPYSAQTFQTLHTLLGEKLLPRENLGVIRTRPVEIGMSAYHPIDNQFQLQDEFTLFLQKLSAIKNPFEQSLCILAFIPYFQLFLDINKRTSRMIANLPLLKHNLPLISLLAVEKKTYITAILAIYELNDPMLLAEIFVDNYLKNMQRYQ